MLNIQRGTTLSLLVLLLAGCGLKSGGNNKKEGACDKPFKLKPVSDFNIRKYGFADACGNMVIPYKYDGADPFRNGISIVEWNGKEFFIDEKGDSVSNAYDEIRSFSPFEEQSFTTAKRNGKTYLLDLKGNEYGGCNSIDLREKYGYALFEEDREHQWIFNLETKLSGDTFSYINKIANGRYVGREKTGERSSDYQEYLLDENGKIISKPYENLEKQKGSEDRFISIQLIYNVEGGSRIGLMDMDGNTLLEPNYSSIAINGDYIIASKIYGSGRNKKTKDELYGKDMNLLYSKMDEIGVGDNIFRIANPKTRTFTYYTPDSSGTKLNKLTKGFPYTKITHGGRKTIIGYVGGGSSDHYGYDFSNGLCRIRTSRDKMGFIDTKGTLVIPYKYDMAYDFESDGTASAFVGDKFYTIDKSGKILKENKML